MDIAVWEKWLWSLSPETHDMSGGYAHIAPHDSYMILISGPGITIIIKIHYYYYYYYYYYYIIIIIILSGHQISPKLLFSDKLSAENIITLVIGVDFRRLCVVQLQPHTGMK
jgi:hypothetical protein